MQLNKAIANYITSRSAQLASNTIKVYRNNLTAFNEWAGDITLSGLTDEHITGFLLNLKDQYSEKTRQNYAHTLRAFFKFWFAKRETNVAWEIISGPRVTEKFPNFISEDQFDLIDEYFNEDEYYQLTQKVIFNLLWNTGMRISELLSLNITDINSQQNHAFITTRKSRKLRMVMWNDTCHELLIRYLGVRICLNKAPELFQTPQGVKNKRRTRLTARTIQRWCNGLENALSFRVHPHAFRHGKCHMILNSGGNRHQVQSIAGHSSIGSSEVYTRLNIQEQSSMLGKFLPITKKKGNIKTYIRTLYGMLNNQAV